LDDINDDEVDNITEGHTSAQAYDDNVRAEQREEKSCDEEETVRHKRHLSGDVSEDEHSHLSSPDIHTHED